MADDLMDKRRGMVLTAFCGDALALGAHWIYDPAVIKNDFGMVTDYLKPGVDSFHKTKDKGEFTHYGDQMIVLLESLVARSNFDLADFADRWKMLFTDYSGYMDKATNATLGNFEKGIPPEAAGADSGEMAGAVRIAPLIYVLHDQPDELVRAAEAQTRMTHAHPNVAAASRFFSQVALEILNGRTPLTAIETVKDEDPLVTAHVEKGLASVDQNSVSAIGRFGRDCSLDSALPGVVHLVVKYQDDLETALVESVMSGGDSAARSIAVGMLLGAHLGESAVPERWLSGLKRESDVRRLFAV